MIRRARKILYEAHGKDVSKDAEDILQDSLVRLIRQYDKLKTMAPAALSYYAALTVQSTAIDFLRKSGKNKVSYYGDFDEIPNFDTPEKRYIQSEEIRRRTDVIRQLPAAQRDLLLYKFVLEQPNSELALMYGTSESNIRQMLSRIRRKLIGQLEEMQWDSKIK